jgi:hypothetical protein
MPGTNETQMMSELNDWKVVSRDVSDSEPDDVLSLEDESDDVQSLKGSGKESISPEQ